MYIDFIEGVMFLSYVLSAAAAAAAAVSCFRSMKMSAHILWLWVGS